jgi:hypothetical protein
LYKKNKQEKKRSQAWMKEEEERIKKRGSAKNERFC